jgi:phosphoribosylanthranilate isomerase
MADIAVKICGLRTQGQIEGAVSAGAAYLGFNFFEKSPRYVTPQDASGFAQAVPAGVFRVGLVVNADDATLDVIVSSGAVNMLQLHGAEPPERVAAVRARYGLPVMKVIGVRGAEDLASIAAHETVADQILVDAKAPKGAVLPGGNGVPFDWGLIAGRDWAVPWMLAGGLTPDNVAEAIARTGATQVDTASGVETAPGEKDNALMAAFVNAAQQATVSG